MLDLKTCRVRWDKENYVPRKVYGFETAPGSGTPREIAEGFLEENRDVLKITAAPADLRYERTVESLGGTTVLFQQYHGDTPIHAAWVTIHIDRENRIFLVKNDTVPVSKVSEGLARKSGVDLSAKEVDGIVKEHIGEYGVLDSEIRKETMVYAKRGQLREAWKVKFSTKSPKGSWILFIDRRTGAIIEERNVLWKATGKGRVFMPNPVVTLDRDDLLDKRDGSQEVFTRAYRTVTLQGLEPGGYLKGPYVDTGNTRKRASSPALDFRYTRDDERFEEVNTYYHIDSFQRYLQGLGFSGDRGILARPIRVDVHGMPDDNSWYDPNPGKKDLTFGNGGVDDAEDAEIILHEYGHALQDAIIPGFGMSHEAGAMGEGFGDYLAASFFSRFKRPERRVRLAEWDAKGVEGGPFPCVRRLDSQKLYPGGMAGEVHEDGEIWSACLWKVRRILGQRKADTVILESQFYLNQYADFRDGAEAIIAAEKNLYGGSHRKSLTTVFKERGIL
jgi:Zn-dependent metalloprotease